MKEATLEKLFGFYEPLDDSNYRMKHIPSMGGDNDLIFSDDEDIDYVDED